MSSQHYQYPSSSLHLYGLQDRPPPEPSHRLATSAIPFASFPYPSPPPQPHLPLQNSPARIRFPSYGHSGSMTPEECPSGAAGVIEAIVEVESDALMESPPSSGSEKRKKRKSSPDMCSSCGETTTCEWRSGPSGLRELCNGCGLLHAKRAKERRARDEAQPSFAHEIEQELWEIGWERSHRPAAYSLPPNTPARIGEILSRKKVPKNPTVAERTGRVGKDVKRAAETLMGMSRRACVHLPNVPVTPRAGHRASTEGIPEERQWHCDSFPSPPPSFRDCPPAPRLPATTTPTSRVLVVPSYQDQGQFLRFPSPFALPPTYMAYPVSHSGWDRPRVVPLPSMYPRA